MQFILGRCKWILLGLFSVIRIVSHWKGGQHCGRNGRVVAGIGAGAGAVASGGAGAGAGAGAVDGAIAEGAPMNTTP